MSALAKVFVVFVFLLSAVFFGTSATLYLTREDWAEQYAIATAAHKDQVERLTKRLEQQRGLLDDAQSARDKLAKSEIDTRKLLKDEQAKTTALTNERTQLEARVEDARRQQAAAETERASVRDENTQLKQLLQAAHDAREQAIEAMKVANAEKFRLARDLAATQAELHQARVELKDTTDKYESLEIQYAALVDKTGVRPGIPAKPIDALVEDVDPELRLVVLSVGEQDEVKEGYEFTVYREDEFVGKIRVHRVFQNMAGARILFTADGASIRQGDRATTRIN